MKISDAEKNTIMDYYSALKSHCINRQKDGGCGQCDLRLFCHTPACVLNDEMLNMVIDFVYERMDRGVPIHSDHCKELFDWPCPCTLDMTSALGSEFRE
jgi:hypothetical protein